MKKGKILLIATLLSVFCSLVATSGKVQAASADILKKWTRINAYECIVDNKLLHSPVEMKDSNGNVKRTDVLQTVTSYQTNQVLTPSYGFGGTTSGSSVPCTRVLGYKKGYNGMTSLLSYGGMSNLAGIKWNNSSLSSIDKLLTSLSYAGEETEDGGGRFSIKAHRTGESCTYSVTTNCYPIEGESSTVGITVTRGDDGLLHYERDSGNFWNDLKISFKNHNLILEAATGLTCTGGGKLEIPLQNDLNTMYADLEKSLTNTTWTVTCSSTSGGVIPVTNTSTTNYTFGVADKVVDSGKITQYVLKDSLTTVADSVNRKLTGASNRNLTSTEQYELYDFYLNEAIKASGASANLKTCNPTSKDNLEPVKLLDTSDNKFKTCYVNFNQKKPEDIKVNAPNGNYTKIIEISMRDVINRLNNLDTSSIDISAITGVDSSDDPYKPLPGSGTDDDGDNGATVSNCIDAAGPLGWIMCPVLQMAGKAAESLYGYIQDHFLWIGSDVMGTDTSTHSAWKTFRNYANIAFIIMFLVVILSQITGFGISNYGIKKILPRLIVVALLTNLSFIICQLAVDLSDIVGSGINTALSSLNVTGTTSSEYGVNNFISDIFGVLFAGAGTLGALGAGYLAAVTWELWLLPLLLAIIGALIGIFIFFLSLAVRQAGIIILVVLCPVAIICYALPNTKKIFDKWFRLFSSLLMVYPICGLLMGGGQFASSILVNLASDGNPKFMLTLTAMLLSVAPFFFIPTIVRTSLNAIGQLGARLSNFGRGMSGRLTGAIRGSERFKDSQRELATRHDEATVRRLDKRAARRRRKGYDENELYTASGQRRRARAYARADKNRRENLVGQSYNGRSLLIDDEERRSQLEGNLAAKDFDERVAGAKASFRNEPRMATEQAIVAEHDKLLEQFGNDPNNIQLQSQLRALEEMAMEKGAPGQDLLQQSFARYATNHKGSWNANKGQAISKLSAGLATRYGKELNGTDKGFNVAMNDFANGDFSKLSSFRETADGYRSAYDAKLAGFTAAGMNKATPGALQRGYAALQAGEIGADNARTLVGNATQALNDELIANDLKATEKGFVQGIASYGASMPGHSSVITGLGQGSLENLARFVDDTNDTNALIQLGQNIQDAAGGSHLYGEGETRRIKMIINKINSKAGTSYTFDPASMQIDQGNQGGQGGSNNQSEQQDIPEMFRVSDAERAQLESDAARNGRRIR